MQQVDWGCLLYTSLFDQNGAVLKADYKIAAGNGISEITIMMDQAWLMDEERTYPVTIDPTVRIEKKQTTIDDAFVRSKDPNSSYGSVSYTHLDVYKRQTMGTGLADF